MEILIAKFILVAAVGCSLGSLFGTFVRMTREDEDGEIWSMELNWIQYQSYFLLSASCV